MELAIGIGFAGNRLMAGVLDTKGELEAAPLTDLYRRGLPNVENPIRRRVDTDFTDWRQVEASEYLAAFGFQLSDRTPQNHQFFETETGNRRYVIPVLALMRALFRPTKHLLPTMFMPQALDQVCRLNSSSGSFSLVIDAKWATEGVAPRHSDWGALLGWMLSHPTANAMAGSVHHQAIRGRLAMTLPNAHARLVLRGLDVGQTVFVTDASVTSISPYDEPLFALPSLKKIIVLHNRALQQGGTVAELSGKYNVPLNEDGSSDLSDYEWSKIEQLISNGQKKYRPFQLSQRDILDGVLNKLATRTPWKKVNYKVGNWQNASAAFQNLAMRGTLELILKFLSNARVQERISSAI